MWEIFWTNNIHFAAGLFGAVVLFIVAWLTFDAFLLKKEFKTFSLSLGFFLFALWELGHALTIKSEFLLAGATAVYLLGLLCIAVYLWLEKSLERPSFKTVIVLPAMLAVLWQVHSIATMLFFLISVLAIKVYLVTEQKLLRPFLACFAILTITSTLNVISLRTGLRPVFAAEHTLKFIAFCFLAYWGWQYLRLRIKEELLLIFVGMALFISIIVTFTFSAILLKNMENEAKHNLASNTKMLDFALSHMKNEALSNAQLFAFNSGLKTSFLNRDQAQLQDFARDLMEQKSMDFLTLTDNKGEVLVRAHSATAVGDTVMNEQAAGKSLQGQAYVTTEYTAAEGMSIRAAAPLYNATSSIVQGAVITGLIVDTAFVDKLKNETGLEIAIYNGDTLHASTIIGSDGRTSNVGTKITDQTVLEKVLGKGDNLTLSATLFSRPYLLSYIPIRDADGKIVGTLQSARLQTGLSEIAASASKLTLVITIIITLMALAPFYYVAKEISEDIN